jgi:hypothetical protein
MLADKDSVLNTSINNGSAAIVKDWGNAHARLPLSFPESFERHSLPVLEGLCAAAAG